MHTKKKKGGAGRKENKQHLGCTTSPFYKILDMILKFGFS